MEKNVVAVIAINENCEGQEKKFRQFLSEELECHGIEMMDFHSSDIAEMIAEVKEKANKVIITFDAQKGMNNAFSSAATELCKKNIIPILIVTNVDSETADIDFAKKSLGEVYLLENPSLEPWDLNYPVLYFSYKNMEIMSSPEDKGEGIRALLLAIS